MKEATVTEVDAAARRITLADGRTLGYDALLLCTGGTPRTLSVPGAELDGVYTLRSLADSRTIRERAADATHAVVVGASFIGMEAAWSLRHHGLDVTVVAPEAAPFAQTFGEAVGRSIQQLHEDNGVRFHLGTQVKAFTGTGRVRQVQLSNGTALDADLVVVGIGVTPATRYLKGVELAEDGSIEVDAYLRAADGLYAAGDIARFPYWRTGERVRIEHWRLASQHGRLAGYTMAGQERPYHSIPFFWTAHFGISFRYVGFAEAWDELTIMGDVSKRTFLAFYIRDGAVHAVLGAGRDRDMAAIEELMRRDAMPPLDEIRGGTVDFPRLLRPLAANR